MADNLIKHFEKWKVKSILRTQCRGSICIIMVAVCASNVKIRQLTVLISDKSPTDITSARHILKDLIITSSCFQSFD